MNLIFLIRVMMVFSIPKYVKDKPYLLREMSLAIKRLQRELRALQKDPVPLCIVLPSPNNMLEWHYLLFPPPDTPYQEGEYHGRIVFPAEYPYKPPAIYMDTPSGRFIPGKSICLSMSEYHPETWNPLWSASSIISGLLSFMVENTETAGCARTSVQEKYRLAQRSRDFNTQDPICRVLFAGNPRAIELRAARDRVREESKQQEDAKIVQAEEVASNRSKMLILTAVIALLVCCVSVGAQIWISQQENKTK